MLRVLPFSKHYHHILYFRSLFLTVVVFWKRYHQKSGRFSEALWWLKKFLVKKPGTKNKICVSLAIQWNRKRNFVSVSAVYKGNEISFFVPEKNNFFEYSDFEFPHVLIVVLLKNAVFRNIFKDSGQQIYLQLLKLWLLIELSSRIILKL